MRIETYKEEGHLCIGTLALTLVIDVLSRVAFWTFFIGTRQSWIGAQILCYAGTLSSTDDEIMGINTRVGGLLKIRALSASV